MDVKIADTFWPSFKKMIDSGNPWKWQYWVHKWYDLKWAIKNYVKYFRIVSRMRPWGSESVLEMMRFQINHLCVTMEKNSNEVNETLDPKIVKMKRFIELADHKIKDDYMERCGFDHNWELKFEDDSEHEGFSEVLTTETEEQKEKNAKAVKDGHELEEKEWNEMNELLKDMRSWWY